MDYTIILLAFTVMALMCPSVYTIAWSKNEHSSEIPVLYIGLGISGLTIAGAIMKNTNIVYFGLVLAFVFFTYIVFYYKPKQTIQDSD